MSVDVHPHLDQGVTELALDHFGMGAGDDHQSGGGVAEIVHS
ncbi:MAG TPA: hypothetical protein VJ796_08290 [Acidimicrobiia bacterium]|nr:hypothetical protein [Acidimicrobiia bacterium]